MTETSAAVLPLAYDPKALPARIVHFGVGNFHRSHQARYLDRLARQGGDAWSITGVGVLPGDVRMRDALVGQDMTYTLVELDPDGTAVATTIGTDAAVLFAPEEYDRVIDLLADEDVRIVTLTITEGGYGIDSAALVAESTSDERPASVFGIVLAGLRERRARGLAPFTIASCDNIESNGHVARDAFVGYAARGDADFADWVAAEVAFPSSMVDRITPVTTDEHRRIVSERYGVQDAWPVFAESFTQWVLEDDFPLGRPPLEEVGVQVVADVRPYEEMKLRLLNASHQALAYWGLLAGFTPVHDAMRDERIARAVRAYMAEARTTLGELDVDLDVYIDTLVARFGNDHVADTLARLATDGLDRVQKFVLPVVRALRDADRPAPWTIAIIGAWLHYLVRARAGELSFIDRDEAHLRAAAAHLPADVPGFLRTAGIFGELADDAAFVSAVSGAAAAFAAHADARDALDAIHE